MRNILFGLSAALVYFVMPVKVLAQETPPISSFEVNVVQEANRLRSNPAAYAERLEALLPYFDGDTLEIPGQSFGLTTREGAAAVEEAIAALRQLAPMPSLNLSTGMSYAAQALVEDQSASGDIGHVDQQGRSPGDRLEYFGNWQGAISENISYSPISLAEWHVLLWVIDDNVPDRGHRFNLLNPSFRFTGIACGRHPDYSTMCAMNYASEYRDRASDQSSHQ
jgi:uncharacterized protein YkwD